MLLTCCLFGMAYVLCGLCASLREEKSICTSLNAEGNAAY